MKCDRCETRLTEPFQFATLSLCCECMSALCSWFLDGGQSEALDLWDVDNPVLL